MCIRDRAIAIAEANRLKVPVIALVDSNSDPSLLTYPIPGNDDSTKSIRIIVDVVLDSIQNGASKRVEAPTKRMDITPVAQEPDFVDQEDEPEVTLPEGYDENDFDDRKPIASSEGEASPQPEQSSPEPAPEEPASEEPAPEEPAPEEKNSKDS